MDLRLVKYFLMTAEELNITSAARLLHITQPTLSKELRHLEEDLGIRLFERSGRSIALTEEGEWFRKKARELILISDRLEQECRERSHTEISGDLYIGVGEANFLETLGLCAKAVHTRYPKIRFQMVGGGGDRLRDLMNEGVLDFIVLLECPEIHDYEHLKFPDQELRGLYMHKDMPLVHKGYVTPEDIRDLPLIVPRRKGLHYILKNWADLEYDDLNIVGTYNLCFAARTLAENKIGCIMMNNGAIHSADLAFVPFHPIYAEQFYLLYRKNSSPKPAARIFLEEFKKMSRN